MIDVAPSVEPARHTERDAERATKRLSGRESRDWGGAVSDAGIVINTFITSTRETTLFRSI